MSYERNSSFQNSEFGAIRTICNEQGDVMFCGKDVCDALGYSNGRDAVRKHVDGDDKTTVAICDGGSNYKSQAIFINESGLYSLILSSKLDSARRFKHWVTSEVLPAIRKQGGYMVARPEETDAEVLARAMQTSLDKRDELIATLHLVPTQGH